MAPNGARTVESTAKAHGARKFWSSAKFAEQSVLELDDSLSCSGTSLVKPKPPSHLSLQQASSQFQKTISRSGLSFKGSNGSTLRRTSQENVTKFRIFKDSFEPVEESPGARGKHCVLDSLRKLNLIAPFLSSASVETSLVDGVETLLENRSSMLLSKAPSHLAPDDVTKKGHQGTSSEHFRLTNTPIASKTEDDVDRKRDCMFNTVKPLPPIPSIKCCVSEGSSSLTKDNSKKTLEYVKTYDSNNNEPFVHGDAYNNKRFVTKSSKYKLHRQTPISVVFPLNEQHKTSKRQHSAKLTQKQLSFVGATPPTASLVDISTGGIVESGTEVSDANDCAVSEQSQNTKFMAGLKASVPMSFYYKQKIKQRQKENEVELEELMKMKDKAREEIKSILERTSSESPDRKLSDTESLSELPKVNNERVMQYKVVEFPPIHHVDLPKEYVDSINKTENDTSPSSDSISSHSATFNETNLPSAPNPSPQLLPNRFHIFPTANPNTFHAYTSSSSQPAVISMDHFIRARLSLNEKLGSEKYRKPPTVVSRRATAGGGVRIPITSERHKSTERLNTDTLVTGHSVSANTGNNVNSDSIVINETPSHAKEEIPSSKENSNSETEGTSSKTSGSRRPALVTRSLIARYETKTSDENLRPNQTKYTPLQSLVIKSCQSLNPVVVIPESVNQASNGFSTSVFPNRTQTASGHLSPLKGIRILRRKVTINHYDDVDCFDSGRIGFKSLLKQPKTSHSTNLVNLREHFKADQESRVKEPIFTHLHNVPETNEEKNLPIQNERISGKGLSANPKNTSFESSLKAAVTRSNLNLNGGRAPSYSLVKDGVSLPLNSVDSNQVTKISLTPIGAQAEKSESDETRRRRRRVQLGSVNGVGDSVCVKIAAGGGFKSNVARYSLLLRQKYHRQQEELLQKQLEEENLLEINKVAKSAESDFEKDAETLLELIVKSRNAVLASDLDEQVLVEEPKEEVFGGEFGNDMENSSRLQIRDLLNNLCGESPYLNPNGELLPEGSSFRRQSLESDDTLINCNPTSVNSKLCQTDFLSPSGKFYGSSPVLPDASTAAYRLTHDVSFDEGSRYRGGGGTNLNGYTTHVDDSKNGSNGRRMVFANQDEQRLNKSVEASGSDRHGPTLSFVRMDERQNPYGFTNPPSSRGQPSQVTNNTTVPMQPAVASRTTFRSSKEPRQGWNHRMGDLSISGGGYYGSNPIQPGGRVDMPSLVSLSLNPASILPQKAALTRDKNGTAIMKSRLSSKYGNRFEASYNSTSAKECSFSDPCVGAPPSFQQRLIEMSLLESDTIKHEKSRKVKRKNKQDKDS